MNKTSKWQPFIALATATSLLLPSMMPTQVALAQSEPKVTPAKVTAALPELEKLASKIIADGQVPGLSIAVVYKDEVVYLKGFGVKKIGDDASADNAVDEDTVFQLASMSKPIASTIVAALVSKGTASWDSRISDLDPAFQLADPLASREVTVRDLFSHRSGLPGNAGNELESMGYNREEILHRLRYAAPSSSFRSGYSYSNFGITEGAVAAAKPTGQAWEDVAEELLYKPLSMTVTSSRYSDFLTRANRATLHSQDTDGKWAPLVIREPDAQSPAGGVSSSARDLAQWMRLELGNGKYNGEQLISEVAIGQTHLPTINRGPNPITGQPSFYALGWNVDYEMDGSVRWGHAGAFSVGARTLVSLNAADQLGIVVLSNAFPTGVPEALASSLFDLVYTGKIQRDWVQTWNAAYDSIYGPKAIAAAAAPYAKKPASPSSALKAEAYVGSYANNYVDARVVAGSDGLMLQLGPKQKPYPLTHFNRDLFLYYPDAEYPNLPSPVSFIIGVDGTATQLQLEDLANVKQSVLPRIADEQAATVFSDDLKAQMDAEIEKQMKENNLPSVAASIVIPGQGEYTFVKGTANLETGRPREFDDPFRIASNTKTFIGLATLRLVDEGKLSTRDTIDTWFPDFPNADKITVGDLLRMRSGIPDPFDEAGLKDYYAHPLMIQTAKDSIAKAAKDPSKFEEPDQITHYVNVNFILLEQIVEKVSGQPIQVVLQEQILGPLELTHTSYPTNTALPGELHGYSWEADSETFRDMTVLNPGVAGGAGAMISDIRDLETYVRALCQGTLLKPETHAAQMTGELLDGKGIVKYGQGLGLFGKFCGHTGTIFGFTTYMMYLPERDATVIINVNRLDEDDQSSATAIFLAITKLAFPDDVSW